MSGEKRTLGAAIFADIEDNEYLNKIHEKVLYNYALRLLQLTKKEPLPFDQKEKRDALRFADLLSKSNDPEKANAHKIWAQVIVILLNELYPEDTLIKLYAGDVFSSIGNHKGIEHIYECCTWLEDTYHIHIDNATVLQLRAFLLYLKRDKKEGGRGYAPPLCQSL